MLNIIAIIYVFKFSKSLLIVSYLDYFKNAFRIFEFKIPNENYFFNHLTEIKRVHSSIISILQNPLCTYVDL